MADPIFSHSRVTTQHKTSTIVKGLRNKQIATSTLVTRAVGLVRPIAGVGIAASVNVTLPLL